MLGKPEAYEKPFFGQIRLVCLLLILANLLEEKTLLSHRARLLMSVWPESMIQICTCCVAAMSSLIQWLVCLGRENPGSK